MTVVIMSSLHFSLFIFCQDAQFKHSQKIPVTQGLLKSLKNIVQSSQMFLALQISIHQIYGLGYYQNFTDYFVETFSILSLLLEK